MAPEWRARSVLAPVGFTCDLASLLYRVTGWHCGIAPPSSPVTLNAPSSAGGCIIV